MRFSKRLLASLILVTTANCTATIGLEDDYDNTDDFQEEPFVDVDDENTEDALDGGEESLSDDEDEDENEVDEDPVSLSDLVSFSDTRISFRRTDRGSASYETITVTNISGEDIEALGQSLRQEGDVFTLNNRCTEIADGESCDIRISFRPRNEQRYQASVIIGIGGVPGAISVPISGDGNEDDEVGGTNSFSNEQSGTTTNVPGIPDGCEGGGGACA